ncbi:MAG: hypothetical protein RLZZ282_648 [Verrucomicrobiota bacterium]
MPTHARPLKSASHSNPHLYPAMKTIPRTALTTTLIAASALISSGTPPVKTPSLIPAVPVGVLSANQNVVQTGTNPVLTWNILYPSKVSDLVVVQPPGTLLLQSSMYVTVEMVGTSVTKTGTAPSTPIATEARVSLNGGSYEQLFYGTQADVKPAAPLYTKKVEPNNKIDFGGNYVENGVSGPFYTSNSANRQIVTLVNGDTPPTTFPLYQSSTLGNHLKPFLNGAGKVNIGPLSVLVLMELGQTNHNNRGFDLQDQVLLVTFSSKHPNNGNGNNLDGVDSSNPGKGHGGPNGMIDPSGGVDDEIKMVP